MNETVTSDELERMMKEKNPPRVLDVRRSSDRQSDPSGIAGAEWKDPVRFVEGGLEAWKTSGKLVWNP